MQFITDLFNNYFITLMLLSGLIIILIANRKNKIAGEKYVWAVSGLVFLLTLFENLEIWCIDSDKPVWILYLKAAVCYSIYPLLIILGLFFIAPVKRRKLILIPYFAELAVIIADLTGLGLIYGYDAAHRFMPGVLHIFPAIVLSFYMIMFMYYSLGFIHRKEYTKALIVIFVSASALLSTFLEYWNVITSHTTEVAVIDIMIYYFYLAAISHGNTQKELYESRIELERQRNKLLVMQMQPHFIFNALATIQSLCYTDSDAAADCIDVFGDYLRANIDSISSDEMISFGAELEHIEQYIKLEKASTDVHFDVIYELGVNDFMIPPLTVQPVVENAIKHGVLTRRDGTGVLKIKTDKTDCAIRITVTDNGSGASLTEKQKEHKSVGTENVRQRLAIQCGGTLDIETTENGAVSVIVIPTDKKGQR
ncbi:MAG: histidine kinase [Oscillospiraceae bacterium]|nr:histidine kinase [Oscillospiraceae bacterium]